jgi:hypothetical protein
VEAAVAGEGDAPLPEGVGGEGHFELALQEPMGDTPGRGEGSALDAPEAREEVASPRRASVEGLRRDRRQPVVEPMVPGGGGEERVFVELEVPGLGHERVEARVRGDVRGEARGGGQEQDGEQQPHRSPPEAGGYSSGIRSLLAASQASNVWRAGFSSRAPASGRAPQ